VVPVPPYQKKLVADTEMTMRSRAVLMIMIDFITVKVALGGPAKSALVLLLRNGTIKKKDGWGRSKHAPSIQKTHKAHRVGFANHRVIFLMHAI
jgi:hypothetical protein